MPADGPPALERSLLFKCLSYGLFFGFSEGRVLALDLFCLCDCADLYSRVLGFQRLKVPFCIIFWQDGKLHLGEWLFR